MSTMFQASDPEASATVIALHSSGAGGSQWRAYAAALPAGVTLHTPDLLGYGTDAVSPAAPSLSLDDEVRRIAPLLRAAAEPVHLVGHSYGGAVALQVALRWPRRVRSLTLYEPVRFGVLRRNAPSEWDEIQAVGGAIKGDLRRGDVEASAERFVDYWGGPGSFAALPAPARARIAQRMPKVCAEFDALYVDRAGSGVFGRMSVPLHLLVGTRSPAPARRVAELLASMCPGAALQRLPGAGHLAPIQTPELVLPHLPFAGSTPWPCAA